MPQTTEQKELREVVRSMLDDLATESAVRKQMAADTFDHALWNVMATDIGLQGLAIPERYGGAGAGWVEQGLVFEELGQRLACVPYLSTVGLATAALLAADEPARERWLPEIAGGSVTATVAVPGKPVSGWYFGDLGVSAVRSGPVWRLTGDAPYVLDGDTADLVLVAARSADGIGVYAVEGVMAAPVGTSDQTRRIASLTFTGTPATRIGGAEVAAAAHRAGITMLACEQAGGAAFCLDQAVQYARVRRQFGRPIGSFQAVQHHCADMLIAVETARSAAWRAVRGLDSDEPADRVATLAAGAACGEAYAFCASMNVQIHGGIGYTWEHFAQMHVKRSRGSLVLLGSPAQHRRALMSSDEVLAGS
ncbi:acyl-CoA dehydrogenase family protein [Amycolatopsis pigmentata]|uniref:Acyl-CoA dehydrogenase family protein n=1 Tax=Amycolatopsis pigmentata TaxID=450801 RepID=A0ABW5G3Q0_9PSEU